jgi:DnaJ-domain-containing protein 1
MEKERFVLPVEIRKRSEEFMALMEEFSALKRQQHVDRTAKAKLAELAKNLMVFVHHFLLIISLRLNGGRHVGRK